MRHNIVRAEICDVRAGPWRISASYPGATAARAALGGMACHAAVVAALGERAFIAPLANEHLPEKAPWRCLAM